jgi:putative ABC transport system permease protein
MLSLGMSVRLLCRDWRQGELTLLVLALMVAVSCISALNNLTSIVNYQLTKQAATLLGADVIVTSHYPIKSIAKAYAKQLGLKQTQTYTFASMVQYQDQLTLAEIRAIDVSFPLIGQLVISFALTDKGVATNKPPNPGDVWIEKKLLTQLNATFGDKITIGLANFIITGIIIDEPGQAGGFTIAPRMIINHSDVKKTAVIQVGSNLAYNWLLAGTNPALLNLKKSLKLDSHPTYKWLDSQTSNQTIATTIKRVLVYLTLGSLMSLVLASIAISLASLRYCQRHQQQIGLLRCFGASQHSILIIYLVNLLIIGSISCGVGVIIGIIIEPLFNHWLAGLLTHFDTSFSWHASIISFAIGMGLLLLFSFLNILTLRAVSPVSIFRQQPIAWEASSYLGYMTTFVLLALFTYYYSQSLVITVTVIGVCLGYIVVVIGGLAVVMRLIGLINNNISLTWRFGIRNIGRNKTNSLLQIIGIGLALTIIVTLALIKTSMISDWQQQLPANTANFFVINIEPNQVLAIDRFLHQQQIANSTLYPIVKGRLLTLNNRPFSQLLGIAANDINALQRDLNLSWTNTLPYDNQITAGHWLNHASMNWISIETGLAATLSAKIGDTLGFKINNQLVYATISSIRTVDWMSFKPNFFILFKPGILNDLPHTYITSFYLPKAQQNALKTITNQFPNLTIIDIVSIIEKLQLIFNGVGHALTFITVFSLLIGIIIAILAMLSLSDSKREETKILKILGMQQQALFFIRSSEAGFIGFYAGMLAIVIAIGVNYYLSSKLLTIACHLPWLLILLVPLLTSIGMILINNLMMIIYYQHTKRSS